MTRISALRVALSISCLTLLGSCELIAGIPERTELAAGGCESFCEMAGRLCTGQFAIYHASQNDCSTSCELYTPEEFKCREEQLKKLEQSSSKEASLYCPGASLGGGAQCSDDNRCKVYCSMMSRVCAEHAEGMVTYPDEDGNGGEACEAKCNVIPDKQEGGEGGSASSKYDIEGDHDGDTLQCRFVHLSLATVTAGFAAEHCEHAFISPQPTGDAPYCSTRDTVEGKPDCDDYCEINLRACTDDGETPHAVYDNEAQCREACKTMELGSLAKNEKGPNVACRKYHSYNAVVLEDPTLHCPHAGPGGAGVCGDDCESFCRLVEAGCEDEFDSEYGGSPATCRRSCEDARKADASYQGGSKYSVAEAKKGGNFACRMYNAASAPALALLGEAQDACGKATGKVACPAFK